MQDVLLYRWFLIFHVHYMTGAREMPCWNYQHHSISGVASLFHLGVHWGGTTFMWRGTSLVLVWARSARHIRVGQAWGPCRGSRGKAPNPRKNYTFTIWEFQGKNFGQKYLPDCRKWHSPRIKSSIWTFYFVLKFRNLHFQHKLDFVIYLYIVVYTSIASTTRCKTR